MAEIGNENIYDIFCHGMLIYPTFYQRWVDSYVNVVLLINENDIIKRKTNMAAKNSKAR